MTSLLKLKKLNKNNISSLNNTPHTNYEHVYRLTTTRNYNDEYINIIHLMLDYSSIYSNWCYNPNILYWKPSDKRAVWDV